MEKQKFIYRSVNGAEDGLSSAYNFPKNSQKRCIAKQDTKIGWQDQDHL
jgi:hypothetical protein